MFDNPAKILFWPFSIPKTYILTVVKNNNYQLNKLKEVKEMLILSLQRQLRQIQRPLQISKGFTSVHIL